MNFKIGDDVYIINSPYEAFHGRIGIIKDFDDCGGYSVEFTNGDEIMAKEEFLLLEDDVIFEQIKKRDKNDNGKRYTSEEVLKMRGLND